MDRPIALFDMDGTLFDYDGKLREDLLLIAGPGENLPEDLFDLPDYLDRRVELIKRQPGWWRNLPILDTGLKVLRAAQEIGFSCQILTKGPRHNPIAWAEKIECIEQRFPDLDCDIVGKNKDNTYGRVLCDDYPKFVEGWLKHRPRGLAILPAAKCNEDFQHPNAIRFDGNNLDQVICALRAAKERENGQHWKELCNSSKF